jgi:hypothetical protein
MPETASDLQAHRAGNRREAKRVTSGFFYGKSSK